MSAAVVDDLRLEGAHAHTNSHTGWIAGVGPDCMFCDEPARAFKPAAATRMLWWCQPCETTWEAPRAAA